MAYRAVHKCSSCMGAVSYHTMMYSYGVCPHCGASSGSTIIATKTESAPLKVALEFEDIETREVVSASYFSVLIWLVTLGSFGGTHRVIAVNKRLWKTPPSGINCRCVAVPIIKSEEDDANNEAK